MGGGGGGNASANGDGELMVSISINAGSIDGLFYRILAYLKTQTAHNHKISLTIRLPLSLSLLNS